jgi:hypothetical protein
VARECSPIANTEGFEVEPSDNYWKMVDAGVAAACRDTVKDKQRVLVEIKIWINGVSND